MFLLHGRLCLRAYGCPVLEGCAHSKWDCCILAQQCVHSWAVTSPDFIDISPLQDVPTVNGTVGSTYSNAYLNATAASQKFYLPPKPATLSGVPAAPCLAALAPLRPVYILTAQISALALNRVASSIPMPVFSFEVNSLSQY